MIRAVIIEDELKAQHLLSSILKEYCPDIDLSGMARKPSEALKVLEETNPDLVFMDIKLEGGNAFDILDALENKSFRIIFTTAYDEYALKAFNYEAVDYLLKPYNPLEVVKAVERVKKSPPLSTLQEELNRFVCLEKYENGKITISTAKSIEVVMLRDIVRIQGDRAYCHIYLADGNVLLVSKPLKEIEKKLPDLKFFRPHLSHLINTDHVIRFNREDGGSIIMKDGSEVPVSRQRKQDLIEIMKNWEN